MSADLHCRHGRARWVNGLGRHIRAYAVDILSLLR
jgi:hypothetical protein